MANYQIVRRMPYSARQLFDLTSDVASYPEFVPLCTEARLWNVNDDGHGSVAFTAALRTLLLICLSAAACLARADALMVNRSVEASNIAQYYIDERGVRVELEIGLNSIDAFRNLLPDAIYQRLGHGEAPLTQRLNTFFEQDFAVLVEASPCRDSSTRSDRTSGSCATR